MQKTIAVHELEGSFQAVIDEVADRHTAYVLTRGQHPAVALVPFEEYRRFQEMSEDAILRRFNEVRARIRERARAGGFRDEEIAADVAAARAELAD